MAFRYPFQSILRLRQNLELQEEQRLFAIAAKVARLRSELEVWEQSRIEQSRAAARQMMTGASGAILQFASLCDSNTVAAQGKLRKHLTEAEQERLKQLGVYQHARQKREIFEGLRDRLEEKYDSDVARHEQEEADDIFLMRYVGKPGD